MIREMRKVGGCGGMACQWAEKKHKKTFWSEKCPGYQLHESTRLSISSELHLKSVHSTTYKSYLNNKWIFKKFMKSTEGDNELSLK